MRHVQTWWLGQQLDCLSVTHCGSIRQHFCCRCPISSPRPALDSSLKTTRGMLFGFFVKPQNESVWLISAFWRKKAFSVFLGTVPTIEIKINFCWVEIWTIVRGCGCHDVRSGSFFARPPFTRALCGAVKAWDQLRVSDALHLAYLNLYSN